MDGARATFVLNWASLGGAEGRALALAKSLAERNGATVEVLALTERDGRAVEAARELGIPWRRIPVSWDGGRVGKARDVGRVVQALRRGRPDVLLPFCSFPNVLCGLVWRWTGARTCIWHQSDVSPFSRVRASTRIRAVRRTPVFVSNSEHGVDHLAREWGAPRERITVVRSGIDSRRPTGTREEARSRLDLGPDEFVACMTAHFRKSKDHLTLLRAWRAVVDRLAPSGRSAVLLLAGDPYPTQDSAKALAFDLRLERTVRFLGDVSDVPGLLGACDVGVLSSLREGFPVSVLEYMAAGLPVVGTDIPGIREAVGQSGQPYLARLGDADSLATAIFRFAEHDELRTALGETNRERVQKEFTIKRMLAAFGEVLAHALTNGRSRGARFRAPS